MELEKINTHNMDIYNKVLLLYKKNHFPETTTRNIPLHKHKYQCLDNIKNTFDALTKSIQYTITINHFLITVTFFYASSKDECRKRFQHIVVLLNLLHPTHSLNIDILFSPLKKVLPTSGPLGEEHANTGYSKGDEIVVYREEEWFKVVIHEMFHNFNFESELESDKWNDELNKIFPIKNKIYARESYCEIWARILNCIITTAYLNLPLNQILEKERKYSRHQVSKILNYMNVSYDQLKEESSYKENTNIIAYYVITDILMNPSPLHFIQWCKDHNSVFKLIDPNGYIEFIKSKVPSSSAFVYHPTDNSTKMTKTNIELLYENTKT